MGSYSVVVEAEDTLKKKKVAIKKVSDLFLSLTDCKRIVREITLLRKMNHPNIIKLYDIILEGNNEDFDCVYLILEYC